MKTLLETAYCFSEIPTGILMHIQHEEQKHGLNQVWVILEGPKVHYPVMVSNRLLKIML